MVSFRQAVWGGSAHGRWNHGLVSYPGLPPAPPPGWGQQPDPGPIPLRPLTAGDLLGAGFGVVRRHLALLGPVAVLVSALSSAAVLGILAISGTLHEYAATPWLNDVMTGWQTGEPVSLPAGMYLAVGASMLISVTGTILMSGLAAACAGVDAMGRHAVPGALAERLRGRIGPLLVTSILVGVGVSIGLFLIVVPGVLLYLAWAAAAPAAVMERSGPGAALQRSTRLTRGHRGRIFGMTLLIMVIAVAIEAVVSAVVLSATPNLSPVTALIVSDAIGAVVAAVTTSWTGAVIALLHIDIRVRTENLASALRAFAATDPARRTGGPALGQA
jgi:hypothetical protein